MFHNGGMNTETSPISWRELETRTGLDALPAFHRAFLDWRGVPDTEAMPLRRVSQRVEAELNRLVQAGQAGKQDDDWLIASGVLDGFLPANSPEEDRPAQT